MSHINCWTCRQRFFISIFFNEVSIKGAAHRGVFSELFGALFMAVACSISLIAYWFLKVF